MGILEGSLIALVVVWTLIFVVFGVAMMILLKGVKKSLDRIDNILSDAENFTHSVSSGPGRAVGSAIMGMIDQIRGSKDKRINK
jgi:hypothetical protein